jgi:hypothetical protein
LGAGIDGLSESVEAYGHEPEETDKSEADDTEGENDFDEAETGRGGRAHIITITLRMRIATTKYVD